MDETTPQDLMQEASDHLEIYENSRARELRARLALAAQGVTEKWSTDPAGYETVAWKADDGSAVAAHKHPKTGIWEVGRYAPGEGEPRAGDTCETLADAAKYALDALA